jgi:hypothetical protein
MARCTRYNVVVQLKTTGVINAEVAGYILKGDRPNQLSFNLVEWFQRRRFKCDLLRDNVSEWRDMSTRGLLFQGASTIKIQLSMLV